MPFSPSRRPLAALAATAAGALGAGLLGAVPAAAATTPYLSEIHYDNGGADTGEAIEVSADPGTSLDGWSVVLYNGSGGAPYGTLALAGVVPASGGVTLDAPGLQNGSPDGVALVGRDGSVVEFLSYEGVLTATAGPASGRTSTDIGVRETGSEEPGQSLQRSAPDAAWTGPAPSTFLRAPAPEPAPEPEPEPTPGADCDTGTPQTIGSVQGSGAATPLDGRDVLVEGVVVADLQGGGFGGFHLQDAGDGDAATSDGVFVYAPGGPDVAVGDRLRLVAEADEFRGQTQLLLGALDVCATGQALPAAAALPLPSTDARREALEGMRVVVADDLAVTEVYNLNRFGEIVLAAGGPLRIPTEVAEPGAEAQAVMADNAARRIVLDDGRTTDFSRSDAVPPFLTVDDPVRVGDRVAALDDVVLAFGFGAWRLQPADGTAQGTAFAATNPRTSAPEEVGGRYRLAAFNVLNYFTTVPSGEGPRAPRGADSVEAFERQEAKIVAAVNALDADVVALMEIENSAALGEPTDEALAALVTALNEAAGAGTWAYVPSPSNLPPAAQQDVITNAIIYKPARVERWGESVALTDAPGTSVAEQDWDNAREPVAQTFVARGDRFTVVANHFKSKSPGGATELNRDQRDGQGAYNADRTGQAQALAAFADQLRARSRDADVVLMGDFNAYTREDPIDVLQAAGYLDLGSRFAPGDYSYVFSGESGSLDHALATASFTRKVTGVDVWNVNAVESYAYQYDGEPSLYAPYPYRASDHDPVVVGFEPVPGRSGDRPRGRG